MLYTWMGKMRWMGDSDAVLQPAVGVVCVQFCKQKHIAMLKAEAQASLSASGIVAL